MKLMFVYWAFEDQGSGLLLESYSRAARELGHEIVVYGRPVPKIPLNYSLDVASADALVFLFEWTTMLMHGDNVDWLRLLDKVPRRRRVIIEGDGNYNDPIRVGADYNHRSEADSRRWTAICDSITDKICQPTFHPLRPNVRTFLFYCYEPRWEVPLNLGAEGRVRGPHEFTMLYVGNSKFRWAPMARVLAAIEPNRHRFGRLGIVGHGWGALPAWAVPMQMEDAYFTDVELLNKLRVELLGPVPFSQVVPTMSRALFNPVISRPTFNRLRIVTPRYFETPAANTIPLFGLDDAYVEEIYGPEALELVLPADRPHEKILDMVEHPERYADIVRGIRAHLRAKHSLAERLKELIAIVES